jgi:hypothetical protein
MVGFPACASLRYPAIARTVCCRLDRGAIFIPVAQRGRNTMRGACFDASKQHAKFAKTRGSLDSVAEKLQGKSARTSVRATMVSF